MTKTYKILVLNTGSTSTKIALFDTGNFTFIHSINHTPADLAPFSKIYEQAPYRKKLICEFLETHQIDLTDIDAVVGRGGNMKPVAGGTYLVDKFMLEDLIAGVMGQHPSNLGGILADSFASDYGVQAYIVDPVVVDEFDEIARISGIPQVIRKSKDHPLNQKANARRAADELGGSYSDFNFIVAHMGGGISVGAHRHGKIIDVNDSLDGEGPFSPNRSGGLPLGDVVDMCFSGEYTEAEMKGKITGKGGLYAYLGTTDCREVGRRIEAGDDYARLILEALAYQVAKQIASLAAVLRGEVDAIVLTGGVAYSDYVVNWIKERVNFIAPVKVYPGEAEMEALVQGVVRVLHGKEDVKIYSENQVLPQYGPEAK